LQKAGGAEQMGQRNGFSDYDIMKLNRMYDCGASNSVPASPVVSAPAPGAAPGAAAGSGNPIVDSFLGGLISGLGLGDEKKETSS